MAGDLLMAGGKGMRLGIALGEREAVAVLLGRKRHPTVRASHRLREEGTDAQTEMTRVFRELRDRLEGKEEGMTEGARVHLAFLPPLADARVIPLPPMRRREVEAVLTRDVARHFLGANRPRGVGIRLPGKRGVHVGPGGGPTLPVLAAAVPLALLESTWGALEGAGWEVASLGAAHGSWLAAPEALRGGEVEGIVAVVGETAHLLRLEGGDPVKARQLPVGDGGEVAAALGSGEGRILMMATPAVGEGLQRALSRSGWEVARDPEGWGSAEESAAARAGSGELELVPPSLAGERRERARRRAQALVGTALVLLLGAAGANLWGLHRELDAIRARRAEIRSEVAPLLLARDSLESLTGRVESVEALSRSAPRWSRSLVDLAVLLPTDTYLTGLFASGDTLELEAAGTRAGEAIQTLRESGLFQEVRLQGVVERELADGETVVERFRLWARLPPAEGGTAP